MFTMSVRGGFLGSRRVYDVSALSRSLPFALILICSDGFGDQLPNFTTKRRTRPPRSQFVSNIRVRMAEGQQVCNLLSRLLTVYRIPAAGYRTPAV